MHSQSHSRRNIDKCPVTFALDIFGDKWSLIIIRDMIFKGKRYYGEFLNSAEHISTNILASRLSKLEAEGLVTKTQDPENLSKYIYRLTKKGICLIPMLLEMIQWSVQFDPHPDVPDNIITGAPSQLLQKWQENRDALIVEILSKIEVDPQ